MQELAEVTDRDVTPGADVVQAESHQVLKQAPLSNPNRDVRPSHRRTPLAIRLERELADPSQWPALKQEYHNVRIDGLAIARLYEVKRMTGFRTLSQVVNYTNEIAVTKNPIPTASLELILSDDRPVQVCGPSGSGKSTLIKKILPAIPGPLCLVDLANEYQGQGLKRIGLEHVFSSKWSRAGGDVRLKFVPSSSSMEVARSELRSLFQSLNAVRFKGHLRRWCFIIEEGHRLQKEQVFLTFVAEARKHLRKLVVVCSDPAVYGQICKLVKPDRVEAILAPLRETKP